MKNKPLLSLNDMEKEILILKASLDIIDSIVNYNVLDIHHYEYGSVVSFKTSIHQEYFSIYLVDFLSAPASDFGLKRGSYISLLKDVCSSPVFDKDNSIAYLIKPVTEFCNWLETEVTIKQLWFPSIHLNIDLKVTYSDFLYIGGNISKHNFTRLSACATKMQRIFKDNNVHKETMECLLALEDYQNWFHGDGNILGYLSSSIAEFLNNIRWGIHRYLQTEFSRSYTIGKENTYSYEYPSTISNPTIKFYYWDLMNSIRSTPYIPEFEVSRHFRNHPLLAQ
ncbi:MULTISPECIES: hypothetical protein [Sporomusaceae]|uniref:Uncharacterized protein n=1 Tax=Sporomusa sphaeroides DSM 2875 TaxID=1337886 RepID=A0ABP2CED8_9FIRM|nr:MULTISPECIES: hypothetical protein [Sporomusaceae]OLS55628.1 hypothetical protein SPSPH_29570 [Sporomusa sphaeroides DSM 2875]CUH96950.1 hypothetical protein P22_3064 [Propionispora sp. 2/2-37]CVK21813.1 hypothetical protein SSPH_04531 [Sporomusa sphaeroides DSM 2875]